MHIMKLTLTPEIAEALIQVAHQQGTTPEILALSCLQQQFLPPLPQMQRTLSLKQLSNP